MTEKEMFLAMIHRVASNAVEEKFLNEFYRVNNDDNTITIANSNYEYTRFQFNDDGELLFFE